jgi:hypothetical protein
MFFRPIILCLLNFIINNIQVEESRILASPALDNGPSLVPDITVPGSLLF